ncbi:YceK/YidQ family lipoprotein [Microbulbifer sp. VAAF005]|uniref:YceK/YidQ family lipoprotein n=1 Tax=unclassified Microbulbifer TaxID=2619833 RepID=UPI0024ACDC20|nr:YceK/YidQ family lipoprotein [Microbulbifer sp. VAAF005]WHI48118.1 YceK/YidQ family lipoprotein [Microbulbifer sp. VAAF005]
MKRIISLVSASLVCVSCATVKTVNPKNNQVDITHRGHKSYCESIPRVYSGTSYSFCLLNSEPSQTVNTGSTINRVPLVAIDAVFSVAADTVVLPYTVVTQAKHGNIKVN